MVLRFRIPSRARSAVQSAYNSEEPTHRAGHHERVNRERARPPVQISCPPKRRHNTGWSSSSWKGKKQMLQLCKVPISPASQATIRSCRLHCTMAPHRRVPQQVPSYFHISVCLDVLKVTCMKHRSRWNSVRPTQVSFSSSVGATGANTNTPIIDQALLFHVSKGCLAWSSGDGGGRRRRRFRHSSLVITLSPGVRWSRRRHGHQRFQCSCSARAHLNMNTKPSL